MNEVIADFMSGDYPATDRPSGRFNGDQVTEWIGLTRADIAELIGEAEVRGAVKLLDRLMREHSDSMAIVQLGLPRLWDRLVKGEVTP